MIAGFIILCINNNPIVLNTVFDPKKFEDILATSWLGRSLYFFSELSSTNTFAKKLTGEGAHHGTLVLTDFQSMGRGQHEHKWIVEPGQNLTFSLIFEPTKADRLNLLTLTCALSVKDTIESIVDLQPQIKWPNDVLVKGKKLCGILTETVFIGNKLDRVIVGIGFNVNQQNFSESVFKDATSLSIETGREFDMEKVLAHLIGDIEYKYRLWSQQDPDLLKDINKSLTGYGDWVKLKVDNEVLPDKFKFLGANNKGELVALDSEMNVKTFAFEQVRVIRS
jgi:BirA family biotin operon repressor/biotin-[acetyl-CoA-carboxylase] ligase